MKKTSMSLKHHFLIAMPDMADPNFAQTVVYLAEHSDEGAMGVIINRPTEISLGTLYERIDLPAPAPDVAVRPVFFGGPVATERGFVLHRPGGSWHGTTVLPHGLALTSSRDVLQAIGEGKDPHDFLVVLGHAGWAPGQLEQELAQNAWLSVPADPDLIFGVDPALRYEAALALLGVALHHLVVHSGHG